MKTFKKFHRIRFTLITFMLFGLLLSDCKKSSDNNKTIAKATSHICGEVSGVEAIYWDLMNGIPRTDLGTVPTIGTIGGTYSHPTYAPLTFIYPTGYTPQTDQTSGAVGVNLIRNDNLSIWRYTSIFYTGTASASQVLSSEVTQVRAFFKSTGAVVTLCSSQNTLPRAAGITTNNASVYITFDGFSAAIDVTVTNESGLGAEQINIVTTASKTSEFANEILHTYLPIDYQLLYTGGGELDSDGDGYPDSIDAFPFDATKH